MDELGQEIEVPGGNESGGYEIVITVDPRGSFTVSRGDGAGETVESLEMALKAVIGIYRDNPVGQDTQEQFAAGFSGQEMMGGSGNVGRSY